MRSSPSVASSTASARASGCSWTGLSLEDGATFTPSVLLTGGDGDASLAPSVVVTAKVVRQAKGPKIRDREVQEAHRLQAPHGLPGLAHADRDRVDRRRFAPRLEAGFGGDERSEPKAAEPKAKEAEAKAPEAATPSAPPAGYGDLTVAEVKEAAAGWDAAELAAALEYEQSHAKRKGAIAALESAISEAED